jgi:hypothetical protein
MILATIAVIGYIVRNYNDCVRLRSTTLGNQDESTTLL